MLSQDIKNLSNYMQTLRLLAAEKEVSVTFSDQALEQFNLTLEKFADDAAAMEKTIVPGHQRNPEFTGNVVRLTPTRTKESDHDLVS
jgi:hypothetical protein